MIASRNDRPERQGHEQEVVERGSSKLQTDKSTRDSLIMACPFGHQGWYGGESSGAKVIHLPSDLVLTERVAEKGELDRQDQEQFDEQNEIDFVSGKATGESVSSPGRVAGDGVLPCWPDMSFS